MKTTITNALRQPIVTLVGHVDHGKTSVLDYFRGTCVQEKECGGITQKISYTKFPLEQIKKKCELIEKCSIKLEIPGFLFIDTPGHSAFTNLRKRGGSLADLAVLVVAIKEGIKPQTAEVLQLLRTYKTPFLIALNKIDSISGWKTCLKEEMKINVESQPINVFQEFQEALMTFQASLNEHGFESDLYYNITDFTKKVAIVPCSAKTGEGMSELLFVLCGLCQRFLKDRLKVSDEAKGVILEIKKEKGTDCIETILYDGILNVGDEIAIASFNEPIISKIRAIEEIESLCFKYKNVQSLSAASGGRLHLTNKEGILPGMPFKILKNNLEKLKKEFKKELEKTEKLDKEGIVIKADSLGSLDALITLLKQESIKIIRAGIGDINKTDIISAKANLENDPLNAIVVGFNISQEESLDIANIKLILGNVVYKIIEDLKEWRKKKQAEIERERMLGLATICKLEILKKYVFRNSNPAIFGVRVLGGKLKIGIPLIDDKGQEVARVKEIQEEKMNLKEAPEGKEVAISLPGTNFERRLKDIIYLYSDISQKQFNEFKKNKDLLTQTELKILQEISLIKGR